MHNNFSGIPITLTGVDINVQTAPVWTKLRMIRRLQVNTSAQFHPVCLFLTYTRVDQTAHDPPSPDRICFLCTKQCFP